MRRVTQEEAIGTFGTMFAPKGPWNRLQGEEGAMTAPLFPLGRILATPGALRLLRRAEEDPLGYLIRHATGDWGDLCAFDRRQNGTALREGYRVFSSYETPAGRVWVITEADRSVTTILLPEEY